jgi:hypothetical protein
MGAKKIERGGGWELLFDFFVGFLDSWSFPPFFKKFFGKSKTLM